ncbi:hypothetical protein [Kribbella speibonae]|uniref:Uncharacterized protein n=1 Tax=Kribbella speibonae TaxID=1572660 RepID=A0A4R0IXA4_9ACTN|nr:hypothetical protein [Kribbella speibonae]TCC36286.1 hypothetical protein E0H92_26910 [Kribbella speibonae]
MYFAAISQVRQPPTIVRRSGEAVDESSRREICDRAAGQVIDLVTVIKLPISLQRDFNNYLSGALPLCVVRGNGLDAWFTEHYIELHSYHLAADSGVTWIDVMDTYAYREVIGTHEVESAAAEEIGSVCDYLVAMIDGVYVTLFVDDGHLRHHNSPFVHELLFYGFDPDRRGFVAAGFDGNQLQAEMAFPFDDVERAVRSGLDQIRNSPRWQKMTAVAQELNPGERTAEPDPRLILGRLDRYAASMPPTPFDLFDGYWWYSRREDVLSGETVRVGPDVHEDARRHLHRVRAGAERYRYQVFHIPAEHKRLMLAAAAAAAGRRRGTRPGHVRVLVGRRQGRTPATRQSDVFNQIGSPVPRRAGRAARRPEGRRSAGPRKAPGPAHLK